jgi:hypothetical protein
MDNGLWICDYDCVVCGFGLNSKGIDQKLQEIFKNFFIP